MKKQLLSIYLLAGVFAIFTACSSGSSNESSATDAAAEEAETTETEAAEVEAARVAYNASISSAVNTANATSNEVLLFDASAKFADIFANGFDTGNDTLSTNFVSGGIFSLDGIHPTAKGYAVLTNLMVDEINTFFNANLPKTNIDGFTEIFFAFPDGYDFSQ